MLHYSRTLHTYSSMLAMVLFVFFAGTGFMLNHPLWFGLDNTHTSETNVTIPAKVITARDKLDLVEFLRSQGVTGGVEKFDWPGEGEAFHISFKSPKSQTDADITLPTGETHLTVETRGMAGMLTRLHTAKDAGPIWRLLLDFTAIVLLFVSLTGLILWQSLPKRRTAGVIAMIASMLAVSCAYWLCVP